jgi:PAS domain S-box-containing protein
VAPRVPLIASDGRIVWVRDQAVLVEDPVTMDTRWQGVMLDITAEKDREQSLQAANDDLEWRVLARTAELEDAAEMMSLEIGERRRVEAELREAENRYRMLVEELPAVVYSWEMNWLDAEPLPEESAAYTSPAITDMLGFTTDEWMRPQFWRERVHPHDRDRVDAEADRCISLGLPLNLEYRYLAKDGGVVWVWDRATLRSRDERGRPRLFQGVLLDITARKEAETKASEAEAWFKRLTEQNPGIMWVVSDRVPDPAVRWRHFYVSPRSIEQSGYPPEAFTASPDGWFDFLHPDDRARVVAETENMWRTGDPWISDFRFIHADGRVLWFHLEGRAVGFDDDGLPTGYQGVILDIDGPQARGGATPPGNGTSARRARRDAGASVDRAHRPADRSFALRVHGRAEHGDARLHARGTDRGTATLRAHAPPGRPCPRDQGDGAVRPNRRTLEPRVPCDPSRRRGAMAPRHGAGGVGPRRTVAAMAGRDVRRHEPDGAFGSNTFARSGRYGCNAFGICTEPSRCW